MVSRKCEHKQWWVPVWTGLVMDEEAKHYRGMKNAIWLFLYLLLNANRKSGFLMRKVKTISHDTGIAQDTVSRWLNTLKRQGYITTQSTGRCLLIQIKKWKTLSNAGKIQHQKPQVSSFRVCKNPIPQMNHIGQNLAHFGLEKPEFSGPNNIKINKYILNKGRANFSNHLNRIND